MLCRPAISEPAARQILGIEACLGCSAGGWTLHTLERQSELKHRMTGPPEWPQFPVIPIYSISACSRPGLLRRAESMSHLFPTTCAAHLGFLELTGPGSTHVSPQVVDSHDNTPRETFIYARLFVEWMYDRYWDRLVGCSAELNQTVPMCLLLADTN